MVEKHFAYWDHSTIQELEKMCRAMPVLEPSRAREFFRIAVQQTGGESKVVERLSGNLFDGMTGFMGASDRKDFSARFDDGNHSKFSHGIMVVETFDKNIRVTFCLARVSFKDYLACGWIGDEKRKTIKAVLAKPCGSGKGKWWKFLKWW